MHIENKYSKSFLITCCYKPPSGGIKGINSYLGNVYKKAKLENKLYFVVGNLSLDCLNYYENLETRSIYNGIFANGCIPLITRPTRLTSKTVSLIDNIFTNFIFDTSLKLKIGIIKSDVSYHFSVFVSLNSL